MCCEALFLIDFCERAILVLSVFLAKRPPVADDRSVRLSFSRLESSEFLLRNSRAALCLSLALVSVALLLSCFFALLDRLNILHADLVPVESDCLLLPTAEFPDEVTLLFLPLISLAID